ncbi:MAG TPA: SDR family oxidoreductase, partial [Candidatus Hydrogenedentes bacterium]|nr:SDR family oxidoreductase [Candidatus Hydrogenedentota bacterium]
LYGRQIARALAEAGADTYVASRNLENLEALCRALAAKQLHVTPLRADQGDEASVLALRDALMERSGRIDVLVNNAVIRPMTRGYQDTADAFTESMRVNATGIFTITRAFGDMMAGRGSGSIVNIGSIQGMVGPDPTVYEGTSMSGWYPDYFFHKGGMINFTRFVASYYGARGVRCNCVSPGGYETPSHPPLFVRNYGARTLLGRMANDTDLMGAVVFLASDASAYVTGVNLPVDGGYTAK